MDRTSRLILEHYQPLPEINAASEEEALRQLEAFLQPRVEAAEQGIVVNKSVLAIFEKTHQEELSHTH